MDLIIIGTANKTLDRMTRSAVSFAFGNTFMSALTGYLGLYWGPRPLPLGEAADLFTRGLEELKRFGSATYYLKGRSRREALRKPFLVTTENVRALLAKGRNRTDTDHSIIEDLGFSISLWSGGAESESYSVSALLAASSEHVKNTFVVSLPPAGPLSLSGREQEFQELLERLTRIFSPESTALKFQV